MPLSTNVGLSPSRPHQLAAPPPVSPVGNSPPAHVPTPRQTLRSTMGNGTSNPQVPAIGAACPVTPLPSTGPPGTAELSPISQVSQAMALEAALTDAQRLRELVVELRSEIRNRDSRIEELQNYVEELRGRLEEVRIQTENRDAKETRLKQEVHKLKSVLHATGHVPLAKTDFLASLHEHHWMPGQVSLAKRQGVSGESFHPGNLTHPDFQMERHDKDFDSKQLIKDAILENDFLKKLDSLQVKEMVDCMYMQYFKRGSLVIKEGEPGSHLYVSVEGELVVKKDGGILGKMETGKAFGELAILYNCTRTASVEAISDAKVWVLDRKIFQMIVMKTGMERQEEYISRLRSVPLLENLTSETLAKVADVVDVEFYRPGDYIIRQGMTGDTFFIITNGNVKVTQRTLGNLEDEELRTLHTGDYFGEQALLREDCRTANVIALHPGVECLALDRASFKQLIGDLRELQDKDYGDQARLQRPPSSVGGLLDQEAYIADIQFNELSLVTTLGVGGFGRVKLVQYLHDQSKTFALKCLTKQHILETQQQEHLFSEKNIMMACRSPFIARLYKTYKDRKYVYMLIEACLGGEVWTVLRDRGHFDDQTTRFYTGCVVEALEYLHQRGIIYRDLKPENLLLDCSGYVKLVDFGFSKRLRNGQKTWTFCGTPEYVAPEIILNKGHDRSVDYWSLGVLMFELFTGSPPFSAMDPMKTYNIILKGIDMIDFPRHISKHAQSLIRRLCRYSPTERLGYQKNGISDIKRHKWFQGFDWDGLKARTLAPPTVPKVTSPVDWRNFDCYPNDSDVLPPDETSGWDDDF